MSTWTGLFEVFQISFGKQIIHTNMVLQGIEIICSFCFVFDIVLNFMTAYIENGEIVRDSKQIVKHYFFSNFFFHLFQALPFHLFDIEGSNVTPWIQFLACVRIERFFAVKELIIHMNVSYENMLYLKFGYYILILVFFLHVNACFWFILINQS